MKTVRTTWDVWTCDVWGNRKDGYDVNDRSCQARDYPIICKIETYNPGTPMEFKGANPSDYQIGRIFGTYAKLETEGDDLTIYVTRASDGYPIGKLVCTSHESLSPIRAGMEEKA